MGYTNIDGLQWQIPYRGDDLRIAIFQETPWLVVPTPLKNISQLGGLFSIYGKIEHVPNHHLAPIYLMSTSPNDSRITVGCHLGSFRGFFATPDLCRNRYPLWWGPDFFEISALVSRTVIIQYVQLQKYPQYRILQLFLYHTLFDTETVYVL